MIVRRTKLPDETETHAAQQMSIGEWWDYLVGDLGVDPDGDHVAAIELGASGEEIVLGVLTRGDLRECLLAASDAGKMVHIMPAEEFEEAAAKLH